MYDRKEEGLVDKIKRIPRNNKPVRHSRLAMHYRKFVEPKTDYANIFGILLSGLFIFLSRTKHYSCQNFQSMFKGFTFNIPFSS